MDRPVALEVLSPKRHLHRTSEPPRRKVPHHTNTPSSRSPSPVSHLSSLSTGQLLPSIPGENNPNASRHSAAVKAMSIRRRARFLEYWWLEIGACFIFILALVAIIVTLRPHQNKPLPQWPYSISINSLMSIYAVALKATILLVTGEGLGKYTERGNIPLNTEGYNVPFTYTLEKGRYITPRLRIVLTIIRLELIRASV